MTKIAFVLLALSVAVPVVGTDAANAAPERKQRACDSYCQRFPSATSRQLKNARAFDNGGEYYERDSNAHPAGSRSWFYLKEQEQGGNRRF